MQLIFIEGVSGVGKTTFARKLCDKLNELKRSANCYLEFDFANPIDFYCAAYFKQDEYADLFTEYNQFAGDIKNNTIFAGDMRLVRYYNREMPLFAEPLLTVLLKREFCWKPANPIPFSEYTRVYKSVWKQFAQNPGTQFDYLIFDGSLFHHPTNDMMRNYNASCDQVIHHVNTLIETVNLLHPRVVYLSSDSVAGQLHKARISRKESPPTEEQIQFWEKRKQVDSTVMKQLSILYDIFDISKGNWDDYINAVIDDCDV